LEITLLQPQYKNRQEVEIENKNKYQVMLPIMVVIWS